MREIEDGNDTVSNSASWWRLRCTGWCCSGWMSVELLVIKWSMRPLLRLSIVLLHSRPLYASPCLWNKLPLSLRQPHSGTSSSISDSPIPSHITCSSFGSSLCSSVTPSYTPSLKPTCSTNPSPRSFTSSYQTAFTDYRPDRFFWATRFLIFLILPFLVPCTSFSWLSRQLVSARKYTVSYYIQLKFISTFIYWLTDK